MVNFFFIEQLQGNRNSPPVASLKDICIRRLRDLVQWRWQSKMNYQHAVITRRYFDTVGMQLGVMDKKM